MTWGRNKIQTCTGAEKPVSGEHKNGIMPLSLNILGIRDFFSWENCMSKVKKGSRVKIFYTGKLKDGSVFETNVGKTPLEFTVGAGKVIKGFENGVVGMGLGQSKTITIKPADGYGPKNPDLVWTVGLDELPTGVDAEAGVEVDFTRGDGTEIAGKIVRVAEGQATIDGNHPLAGRNLTFELKLAGLS